MGELREGRPELDIITGLVAFGPMCDEGIRRLQTAYIALPPFLPWIKATISAIVKEQTREVVYEFCARERALQPSEWDCQPQEWGLYSPPVTTGAAMHHSLVIHPQSSPMKLASHAPTFCIAFAS